MISGNLKLVTPPEVEPVTLEEALTQCHADEGVEDEWFLSAISAAREACEDYQWRAYISQVYDLFFDSIPNTPLYIPRAPLIEVQSVKVYDSDNVEYDVDLDTFVISADSEPARLTLAKEKQWPAKDLRSMSAVKIRFRAGYGESADLVPVSVKRAILLYVGWMYGNREGEGKELPKAFYDLLRPNRLYL